MAKKSKMLVHHGFFRRFLKNKRSSRYVKLFAWIGIIIIPNNFPSGLFSLKFQDDVKF